MENQHRKIKGYRELTHDEIELMNQFKEKGKELLQLHERLSGLLATDAEVKLAAAVSSQLAPNDFGSDEWVEWERFKKAEPMRWAEIGRKDIQTGIMALVRAVAQPSEC